jgi:Gram-negative bacterial TonB protein C-terminal
MFRSGLVLIGSVAVACAHAGSPPPAPLQTPVPAFVQASATCAPAEPRLALTDPAWRGLLLVDYVVQKDGTVGAVGTEVLDGAPSPAQAIATTKDWIMTACRFSPATIGGVPAAVELGQVVQFGPPKRQVPMLHAGMTRPAVASCAADHPPIPQAAFGGTVLVQYVVEPDGRATDIELKAPGPVVYFRAVREWLSECRFDPATEEGRAVAVRIVQPFVFQPR